MKRNIIHLEQTDSTNRWLHDMKEEPEGMTVVVADFQTAGKGQGTREFSPRCQCRRKPPDHSRHGIRD